MNILRELRKIKHRNIGARVALVLIFATCFIINTFAWFSFQRNFKTSQFGATVREWNIEFKDDAENELEDEVLFSIEMYPGMPDFEENIYIRNKGDYDSSLSFALKTVTLYGELIYSSETIEGFTNLIIPQIDPEYVNGVRYLLVSNESYDGEDPVIMPFTIQYSYNKDELTGKYIDDSTTPDAYATFTMNVEWDYELIEDNEVNIDRDDLDTQWGKDAYHYYTTSVNEDENETFQSAMEIVFELHADAI